MLRVHLHRNGLLARKMLILQAFREVTGYQHKMFADSDRKLYKALKCEESMNFSGATTGRFHAFALQGLQ